MSTKSEREFATWLHKSFCTSNHTDACSWFYEADNWNEWTHKRFLAKAKALLKTNTREEVEKIVQNFKEVENVMCKVDASRSTGE